jgi:hypothetical protein
MPEAFQHANDGLARARKEGVIIAGDEERNAQSSLRVVRINR